MTSEIIRKELSDTSNDLKQELQKFKLDLIKWMFGFWVTLVLLIIGSFFLKH